MIDKEMLSRYGAEYGIPLSGHMLESFDRYAALLVEWNQRMNLTAITEPEEICVKHFLDSILILREVDLPEGVSLIDVGTGAGFPGIPLKIVRPDIRLTLLDSLGKRVEFLKHVSQELGQDNRCVHSRAEDGARDGAHREQYDIAVARAVAALPTLAEYCLPFVRVGGRFLAMKGADPEGEIHSSRNALELLGGRVEGALGQTLPGGDNRSIIVVEKRSQTPTKYPRNPGKPQKKPL